MVFTFADQQSIAEAETNSAHTKTMLKTMTSRMNNNMIIDESMHMDVESSLMMKADKLDLSSRDD